MVQFIFVSSFKSRPHEDYFISYHIITFYETMASTCTSYTHSDQKRDVGGWGLGDNSPWGDPAPLSSCPWCCPSQTPLLPHSHSPCCQSTSVSRTTLISLHWTSLESQFMLLQLLVNYWIKNYFLTLHVPNFTKQLYDHLITNFLLKNIILY